MFSLGPAELVVLLLIGGFLIGVPLLVTLLVIFLVRRRGEGPSAESYAVLAEENRRLREEIARLKKEQG
jgi:hypothetical protein